MIKLTSLTLLLTVLIGSAQDYTQYSQLLKKYAKPNGVAYKAWSGSMSDKMALDEILKDWSKVDTRKLAKNERAAFRVNLYNATMLDVVLDNYPLKSVTKLGAKDFAIFDEKIISTPNGLISLNELEKKHLLKDFPDARLHFAVNCASVSCPPLSENVYVAGTLEAHLTKQAQLFSKSDQAVRVSGNTAYYSELFNWYEKDFGTKNPAMFLNKYRSKSLDTSLKISWIKYDWNLNSAN